MKTKQKAAVSIVLIGIIILSFFAGRYVSQRENAGFRRDRCGTQIEFAISKLEKEDLADQGVMRALISDVYGAYLLCDDAQAAAQLHDLWNFLIFESDGDPEGAKETALTELNDLLRTVKTDS